MLYRVRAIACAIALTALLAGPHAAQACSVCLAGDPVFDTHGTTGQQAGDFSVYFEVSGWSKKSGEVPEQEEEASDALVTDSGLAPEEEVLPTEENHSQRLDIYLSWAPLDRVTLTLDVPFAFNNITEFEDGGRPT